MKKIFLTLLFIVTFTFITVNFSYSQDASDQQKNDLENKIVEYQKKLSELNQQKNTLASQIQYMDTQTKITELRIRTTEEKIKTTQKEIQILGDKITNLDNSLNHLSKLLLNRIAESYKKRSVSIFSLFFDSSNANDFLGQIKYLKTAQENNQKLLVQVQGTKSNFEEQKKLREQKKIELDKLTITLSSQKQALDLQKAQKQKLLIDTQNDETTYQRLLAQAQAQLASFKSFVQTSGGGSIITANGLGSGADGNYYSQRDIRWANQLIGYSSENVLSVGCLLTSVSMVAKKLGENITPSNLASDLSRFYGNTAYMSLPWKSVGGKSYVGGVDIDQELSNGNYVIVGVGGCYSGGSHFVVLTKKDGSDYIMHDPIYGPDIKFSAHYSNICSSAAFK